MMTAVSFHTFKGKNMIRREWTTMPTALSGNASRDSVSC